MIVLVVDTREGITTEDEMVAGMLRRAQKPIMVQLIKWRISVARWIIIILSPGLGDPIPISAEHGMNINLLDVIVSLCLS